MVKNGRRGSITGDLLVRGVQGHVAYPHLADNPIHKAARRWRSSPPSSGTRATPTSPPASRSPTSRAAPAPPTSSGELQVQFNFRFSTELTDAAIRERVEALLTRHGLDF